MGVSVWCSAPGPGTVAPAGLGLRLPPQLPPGAPRPTRLLNMAITFRKALADRRTVMPGFRPCPGPLPCPGPAPPPPSVVSAAARRQPDGNPTQGPLQLTRLKCRREGPIGRPVPCGDGALGPEVDLWLTDEALTCPLEMLVYRVHQLFMDQVYDIETMDFAIQYIALLLGVGVWVVPPGTNNMWRCEYSLCIHCVLFGLQFLPQKCWLDTGGAAQLEISASSA